jgi:hypothetical protein
LSKNILPRTGNLIVIQKIKRTGTTDRQPGQGRPRTAVPEVNLEAVMELALSQEDEPGSHFSQRQISISIRRSH